MAAEPFNSLGGFSVGIPEIVVVDNSGNVVTNVLALSGNVAANAIYSNNYFYANGSPLPVGNVVPVASGSNTQVQFNDDPLLGASPNFTFDKDTSTLTIVGNIVTTNLTSDNVSFTGNNVSLGNVSALKISGGTNGQVLTTDGDSNLDWTTIGEVTNVLYVSKNGNDTNDGKTLNSAKLTIKAAIAQASAGTTIFVKSGDYTENNPVSIPEGVSIVGDNLRSVSVRPAIPTQDIFWVRNRDYITGMTFRDHLEPAAAIAFPPTGAGFITTSPYIQNCSSITTTGCGMRIDGSYALGLKSMVVDSYTQFNQGGKGIHIINQGYAQLVSVFTICCSVGIQCQSGGQCSVSNSNNSFGDFALWAEGQSPELYSGTLAAIDVSNGTFLIEDLEQRPAVNDSFRFDGFPDKWYTVKFATPLDNGQSIISFDELSEDAPNIGTITRFYQPSLISASSQTFEYVGTGTNLLTATPRLGGVPIQENEITQLDGGIVSFTSTDQFGDFRIGGGLLINETAGIISGITFEKSLFSILTPYILALEG
jgi:hypothetical protein